MSGNEWSLVFFTLIAQMSVGAFFLWEIPRLFNLNGLVLKNHVPEKPYVIFTLLAGSALLISFFHLGTPSRAIYSLSNLATSWLSREILFALLFSSLLFCSALLMWKKIQNQKALKSISALTIFSGMALIFSMSRLYMISTVPAWDTPSTMIEFFTSMIVLGLVTAVYFGKKKTPRESGIFFISVLPVVLFIKLVNLMFTSFPVLSNELNFHLLLLSLNTLLLLVVTVLIVWGLLKKKTPEFFVAGNLFYIIAGLLLFSEVAGRYLFFVKYFTAGI